MNSRITLNTKLESSALITRLQLLRDKELPKNRRTSVEKTSREILQRIIQHNPVDTGRSRSAWVSSLQQLEGTPPAGWIGPNPQSAALGEGASQGRLEVIDSTETTEINIQNSVPYIAFLEFGTQAMAPFRMVRRSLLEVRNRITDLFSSLFTQSR